MTEKSETSQWFDHIRNSKSRHQKKLEEIKDLFYCPDSVLAVIEDLEAAGFEPWIPDEMSKYELLLQKTIRNDVDGKLYFINVKIHDWYEYRDKMGDDPVLISLSSDVQFTIPSTVKEDESSNVNVTLLDHVVSPEQLFDFYAKAYVGLGAIPYDSRES